ncbi:MAG: hypothetical protein PHC67_13080, partial [Methanoculleus sp.]|nr:hypothetical protein [Methanoculleus sp.]
THAALPGVLDEQRLLAALAELRREHVAKSAARTRAENLREILQTSYAAEREKFSSRTAALAGREVEVDVPDLPSPAS